MFQHNSLKECFVFHLKLPEGRIFSKVHVKISDITNTSLELNLAHYLATHQVIAWFLTLKCALEPRLPHRNITVSSHLSAKKMSPKQKSKVVFANFLILQVGKLLWSLFFWIFLFLLMFLCRSEESLLHHETAIEDWCSIMKLQALIMKFSPIQCTYAQGW